VADRPILFSAPMVRALLAGTKTQTRRAVKMDRWRLADGGEEFAPPTAACPYGQPGDRLWVREAWARTKVAQDATGAIVVVYRESDSRTDYGGPWKPSIHMPRAASRITLDITRVRVERLQAISEADAIAEGIVQTYDGWGLPAGEHYHAADPRQSYFSLWEAINGPGSVEANPWLWVVEFKRLEVAHG